MDVQATFQHRCKRGLHPFEVIYSLSHSDQESTVVNWCSICGTISVDLDIDGRIKPGAVQKATRPKILEQLGK